MFAARSTTVSKPLRIAVLAVVLASSARAAAQNPSVVAESLFQEGKKLMAEGKYAEACPKLAESYKLDPGAGALTATALCHKAEGKTASAWIEFKEVVSLAKRDGRKDREQVAVDAIAELEPKLSKLRINVFPSMRATTEVKLDDAVVPRAAIGQAYPADPGTHRITATAAGKKPFETTVQIGAERDEKTVDVPALADDETAKLVVRPETQAPVKEAPPPPPASNTQRYIGYGVAGAGVVAVAVGGIFGLRAISKDDESNNLCGDPCASPEGLALNDDARSAATISNVVIGLGLAAVAGGVILALTAPKASPRARAQALSGTFSF